MDVSSRTISQPRTIASGPLAFARRLRRGDEVAHLVTFIFASMIVLITVLLFFELYRGSALARREFGWSFVTSMDWDPVALRFGALPFIYGTLVTSALALILGVPLGVGAAMFLAELAPPRVSAALAFLIDLLAAVPSVIYGLLAIFTLVPFLRDYVAPALRSSLGFLPLFQGPMYGFSMLAGGCILAIMILPFIISISREVLLAVPRDQREASLALGATHWETAWNVVVPYAKAGISGSVFLALARALGETMAITMVIGNTPQIQASLFAPAESIAAVIANEFTEAASNLYLSALIELGLVLFCITIIVNAAARLMILGTSGKASAHV